MNKALSFYKWFFPALCMVFLLMAVAYYLIGKKGSEAGKTRIGKEILVAKDQGRGGGTYPESWCGSRGVLNKGDNLNDRLGIEFIDFATKERIQISSNAHDRAVGCSPDGRWALYTDSKNIRYDNSYEYIEGEISGWMGEVVDLYRYEISTGKRERVAMVRNNEVPEDAVSPDGKKIFLGFKHSFSNKVAVPEWKGHWLTNEWYPLSARWFPDSSGIALDENFPPRICVEFFGKGGWAKCFALGPEIKGNEVYMAAIDRENRIYFTAPDDHDPYPLYLYRCKIKDKELFCERMVELDRIISSQINFLPDGDMIFKDKEKNCISRFSPKHKKARCIIDHASLIGVSRDGKWLAYERGIRITKPDGEFSHWQYDLYARELYNN